jgi:hypothetical protein
MFRKRKSIGVGNRMENSTGKAQNTPITLEVLRERVDNMEDAEIIEHQTHNDSTIILVYIRTLIDKARLNESVIQPLRSCGNENLSECGCVSLRSRRLIISLFF